MDLIDVFNTIERKEDFEHGLPQSGKEIRDLEVALNVKFPESYKELLQKYGYISWLGGSIYGPSKDAYYDLLIRNKELREERLPEGFASPPKEAFLIKDYGEAYIMLFSDNSPRAGQVGLFLSETGYQEEQTWESFEALKIIIARELFDVLHGNFDKGV